MATFLPPSVPVGLPTRACSPLAPSGSDSESESESSVRVKGQSQSQESESRVRVRVKSQESESESRVRVGFKRHKGQSQAAGDQVGPVWITQPKACQQSRCQRRLQPLYLISICPHGEAVPPARGAACTDKAGARTLGRRRSCVGQACL
eukprot:356604-Chlamydomonas_euryale.AAC.5